MDSSGYSITVETRHDHGVVVVMDLNRETTF